MPTGSASGSRVRVTRSAPTTSTAPSTPEASSGGPGAAGQPDGDLRHDQRDEGDRPGRGDGEGDAADGDQHRGRLGGLQPHAEAAGGVVAELEDPQHPAQRERQGQEHRQRDGQGQGVVPGAGVERSGDPDVGGGGVVDLGVREQPVDERGAERPEGDADQDQAVAVDAGPPGEQEQQDAGAEGAQQRGQGDAQRRRAAPPLRTMAPTAPTDAPIVMPRVSGEARGLRAKVWNSAPATPRARPTSRPTTIRGRPQLQDDEVLRALAEADQRAEHVGDPDREVAAAQTHRRQQHEDGERGDRHGQVPPVQPARTRGPTRITLTGSPSGGAGRAR